MTWEEELESARWVPGAVAAQMDEVWDRVRSVTAAPLEYVGAGGSAVVFREGDRVLKVARHRHPVYFSLLETEAELLADAHRIDPEHVVRPHAFLAEPIILVKDYVDGDSFGWLDRKASDHFMWLADELQKVNWGPPERKDDGYVRTKDGFVLVDGGHASRLCTRLLDWLEDYLDGRRHPWTVGGFDHGFLAFLVRREAREGCVDAERADTVLTRLGEGAMEPNARYRSYVLSVSSRSHPELNREWPPATYEAAESMRENVIFQLEQRGLLKQAVVDLARTHRKPVLEWRDGMVRSVGGERIKWR